MTKDLFHKKISLILSFLILNNYLLISLSSYQIFLKINFLLFLSVVLIFYFKDFYENPYLKIFFLIILFICLGVPTSEWDARSIWLFHAKRIFYDSTIFSVADNYAAFSHNNYPTLAPAFASSAAVLVGHWNEVFPKISFSLMFLPPLILTYVFLKNTYYIIFLNIIFFIIGKYLFNGWADGLLAVYFCLSALLMYLLIIYNDIFYEKKLIFYLITLCFFVILTLIKNEGTILLLTLFVSTFFILLFNKKLVKNIYKLIFLCFSFLPIIFWKIFCLSKGIDNIHFNENILFNILPRIYEFNNYKLIFSFMFFNEKIILSIIFFCLSFILKKNNELFSFIFIAFLLYIFVLFIVFLSTPVDLYFQLDSSAARIIKSPSFLLAFFGLYNLGYNKIKN